MDNLIEKLDKYLIEPMDWEVNDIPDTILNAALAATDAGNLTAVGRSDDLGWFVIIREAKAFTLEQEEEK